MHNVPVCGVALHKAKCQSEKWKNVFCITSNWQHFGTRTGQSLKRDRRAASSPPLKSSGNPGMLLQASAPDHGGSYILSLKWKRNVTGDSKANGFFRFPKIVRLTFSAYVNVYIIRTAPTASYSQEGCFEKERRTGQEISVHIHCFTKHRLWQHPIFKRVYKMVKKTEDAILISPIGDTPSSWLWIRRLHAVSCVLWLALLQPANRRRLFFSSCHTQGKCFSVENRGEYQLELWACRTQMAVHRTLLISQRKAQKLWKSCTFTLARQVSFNRVKKRKKSQGASGRSLSVILLCCYPSSVTE